MLIIHPLVIFIQGQYSNFVPHFCWVFTNISISTREKNKKTTLNRRFFFLKVSAFFNSGDGLFVSVGILKRFDPQKMGPKTIRYTWRGPGISQKGGGSPERLYNAQGGNPMWRPFWFFSSCFKGDESEFYADTFRPNFHGGPTDPALGYRGTMMGSQCGETQVHLAPTSDRGHRSQLRTPRRGVDFPWAMRSWQCSVCY